MKKLLILTGLVAIQLSTTYCCWDGSHRDDDDEHNPQYVFLREDEVLDAIVMHEKESFWVYRENTTGRLDTVTVIDYDEEQKIESGIEYGIVYTKKILTLHSSLTDEVYDIGLVKPIPDEVIPHHRPMLFRGDAAKGSDNDTIEDIIYCKWTIPRWEEISLELINQEQLIIEPHIDIVLNGKKFDNIYKVSQRKMNGDLNSYFYDEKKGLIMYRKNVNNNNLEEWGLVDYHLIPITD